ncbi:MAG: hypothetical protein HQ567_20275 [Candidatus Nealsonbacteria bacterium]|nr:hypothetical protein [Candidatus Nealsonbacteria bacterium]
MEFPYSEEHLVGRRIEPRHSGLGIASFVLALFCGVMEVGLIVVAGIMEGSTPGGIDEEAPEVILLGLCLLGGAVLSLLGVGLGIGGLLQSNRKVIFAVLGVLFNAMVILGVLGLMVLGMAME